MARRKRTAEEEARRAKIRELLQASNIGSMEDIQNLFKETIDEFMEAGLDAELDEELGYSKYDYRNKNKDLKALMSDLKAVYATVDEDAALSALDAFSAKWDGKYPQISSSWRDNWANLSTYFKYPQELRKLIYTTNAIEAFYRIGRINQLSKQVVLICNILGYGIRKSIT